MAPPGTWPATSAPEALRALLDEVRAECGVRPVAAGLAEGVQVRARVTAAGERLRVRLDYRDGSVAVERGEA
ncbi:hypothetical protein RB200_20815 [Streptomyces sp. PmtG]